MGILDDIVGGMLSDVAQGRATSKKQKRETRKKHKAKAAEKPKKKPYDKDKWKNPPAGEWQSEAMVMIVYHATCSCCGHEYEMPNRWVFIRRFHKRLGFQMEKLSNRLDIEAARYSMPKVTEHEHITVQTCPMCFDLEGLIEQARCGTCPTIQLDMFNS